MNNYHKILGINESASKEEIKKAYRKLALQWHPDRNSSSEATKKMQEISEAYEKLNDEGIRKVNYNSNYYDDEVPQDGALIKETLKNLDDSYYVLRTFYVGEYDNDTGKHKRSGETAINDYDLERVKRILQLLNTVSELNKEGREYESYHNDVRKMNSTRFRYINDLKEAARKNDQGFLFSWFDEATSWENNFNRVLRLLNHCRGKMGLNQLTESDLNLKPIKGPNETPQIPGEKPRKPIEDGEVNVEEYNKLYSGGNHEDIRKYWELRDKIYNLPEDWQKYKKVNSALYGEMDDKSIDAEKGSFRIIWNNENSERISEVKRFNENKLAKMKVAASLMERLIKEGENYNPTSSQVNSDKKGSKEQESASQTRADNIKIQQEARKAAGEKDKTVGVALTRLIFEGQTIKDYVTLENKIKEIDKYQGEAEYETHQVEIKALKTKLGKLDQVKFKAESKKRVDNLIQSSGIKKDDLDQETKEIIAEIEKESDVDKINELESIIGEKVGIKKSQNQLERLLQEIKKLVNSESDVKKVEKVKKDFYEFYYSNNRFNSSAIEIKKNEVANAIHQLENQTIRDNTQSPKGFFRPGVIVPLALATVALLGGITLLVKVRNKRKINKK